NTMARVAGGSAEDYIIKQIDEMHEKGNSLKSRIAELESLMETHELSDIEFDVIRQVLSNFKSTLDVMDIEQKREAIRAFVKRIVWDGQNVNMYLFGSDDENGLEMPPEEDEKSPSGGYSK
ncbi:MAG: recombinase family protein, partial [Defluviitaleaceae bacterium]|nr:recombinase family protein [Defluviitaleaceae bacterium]